MKLQPNTSQYKFLQAKEKCVLYAAGRGSGKSHAGSLWCITLMAKHPGILGMALASNPAQCNSVLLKGLTTMLDDLGIQWTWGQKPPWTTRFQSHVGVLSISNGSQLLIRSAFEYDRNLRGLEVGFLWIDEARDIDEGAFDVALACLRGQGEAPYQVRITSTPNGFGWLHKRFVAEPMPDSAIIMGRTSDNAAHLPPGYEDDLRSRYGARLASQELDGAFVSLSTGQAYEFDRLKHVRECKPNPALPLILSADQNVSPMCSVIMQVDTRTRTAYVLDEIVIEDNASTQLLSSLFVSKWGSWTGEVWYFCDLSSEKRDTRQGSTDFAIMGQVLRAKWPRARDAHDRRQRLVLDGVNSVNSLLNPAIGPPRLFIDPKAKTLIHDFENVSWEPGTRRIAKDNDRLSHQSDACRYVCAQLLPCTGPAVSAANEPRGLRVLA